jgi:hypothetical protein
MIIRIKKSVNKEEDGEISRPGADEYIIELEQNNEKILGSIISISETEKRISTQPLEIDLFSESNAPSEELIVTEDVDIFPDKIVKIISDSSIRAVVESENRSQGYVELTIRSDIPDLLELDWEKLFQDTFRQKYSLFQKRVTETKNKIKPNTQKSDFLNTIVLLSYSNEETGHRHDKIFDHFQNEIAQMLKALYSNLMRDKTKPNLFTIARYINRESIKILPFASYNLLHISAHGVPGKIGFEDINNSGLIDWIEANEIECINAGSEHTYKVVFLATCYGANNIKQSGSIAYEIINKGLAESVIAFKDAAGSEISIPKFAEYFYNFLMAGHEPEESYEETMKRISTIKEIRKLKPIFYSNYE